MRELISHVDPGLNEKIQVFSTDQVGPGGAYHNYTIYLNGAPCTTISFQNGAVLDVGLNGISAEALLAIVKDRLECFQSGPFACLENAAALVHIDQAMTAMKERTINRVKRNVEGRLKV